ncbi:hypothetical protein HPB50_015095 [Hyalomma asiaticum]|uniref:Uncharacterized protein n=1 Tax=Hyalomma asiaticum TaxID=266040 RepID=A0ACB7T2W5_HYAAI|nr:hypothetical protein HPB50_015095 [Hyalomma asiaticum]
MLKVSLPSEGEVLCKGSSAANTSTFSPRGECPGSSSTIVISAYMYSGKGETPRPPKSGAKGSNACSPTHEPPCKSLYHSPSHRQSHRHSPRRVWHHSLKLRSCPVGNRGSSRRGYKERQRRKKRNLTPEEALDLYFSLPDLESASEDDSEEYCEELPSDLQSENDSESDEVELAVPTVKRKKKPPRLYTGKQKKRRCSSTAGSSAAADASDIGMEVDESMILFKGRSSMKQYVPMKPKIKRGYKFNYPAAAAP